MSRIAHRSKLRLHPEVKAGLNAGSAIVALESNVISHGLPHPLGLETINEMEAEIRAAGAIPAITALQHGEILIGLSEREKVFFATEPDLAKASSRDLPMLLASGQPAVTTVAASLVAAELSGIRFFASAGIGGVHRGAQLSFDISSDLIQITRSPVVVVTAGCKNMLDIGLTLEFLETHCVPCVTYRFNDFPAFYVRSSGFRSPFQIDDMQTLVRAIVEHRAISSGGFLVAAPIDERDAIAGRLVEDAIEEATRRAATDGVTGKELTKFVMRAVSKAMDGKTDQANSSVLVSNAKLAAELAVCYNALSSNYAHVSGGEMLE